MCDVTSFSQAVLEEVKDVMSSVDDDDLEQVKIVMSQL